MEMKPPGSQFADWIQLGLEAIPVLLVSMFGGLVNILNTKKSGFSVGLFFTGLITAGFVGLIIDSLCGNMGVSGSGRFIAISMGGYCSRDILALLKSWFLNRVCKTLQDKESPKK